MNPEAQRKAIAMACGWTVPDGNVNYRVNPIGRKVFFAPWYGEDDPVPDYLNDLNAMREAEKTLLNQFTTEAETYWRNLRHVQPHPIFATAAQRAEAFLKTKGLWTEQPKET